MGLIPADNPRLAIAISVDTPTEGYAYGGVVAAPAFAEIAAESMRILGIAPTEEIPEKDLNTPVISKVAEAIPPAEIIWTEKGEIIVPNLTGLTLRDALSTLPIPISICDSKEVVVWLSSFLLQEHTSHPMKHLRLHCSEPFLPIACQNPLWTPFFMEDVIPEVDEVLSTDIPLPSYDGRLKHPIPSRRFSAAKPQCVLTLPFHIPYDSDGFPMPTLSLQDILALLPEHTLLRSEEPVCV